MRASNEEAKRLGKPLEEERATDFSEELAQGRYRTFKDKTYAALQSLREDFHYHFINAMAPLHDVEQSIMQEFQYQSLLELGHDTYDSISKSPSPPISPSTLAKSWCVVSIITRTASANYSPKSLPQSTKILRHRSSATPSPAAP